MKRRQFLASSATLAGALVPVLGRAQSTPCPPPSVSVGGGSSATAACGNTVGSADWVTRSTGPGVIWAHDFSDPREVDQFRYCSKYETISGSLGSYGYNRRYEGPNADPEAHAYGDGNCRWVPA